MTSDVCSRCGRTLAPGCRDTTDVIVCGTSQLQADAEEQDQ